MSKDNYSIILEKYLVSVCFYLKIILRKAVCNYKFNKKKQIIINISKFSHFNFK